MFGYLAGSLSYTVLVIWIMISAAAFILSLKRGTLFAKYMNLLALVILGLILIGILLTNSIGVTVLTALLYLIIFFSYRKKNDSFAMQKG